MTIESYLRRLERWLGRGPRARRILEEVHGHLEDAAEASGNPTAAERAAVARFGSPGRVALDFFRRTPLVLFERLEPLMLLATTAITLLFAGAATFFTTRAIVVEGGNAFSAVQLVLSALFTVIVVLIWAAFRMRARRLHVAARLAGVWVLGAGILGAGLATWSGVITGDWEYYLFVMNGNLAAMGVLMLRCFRPAATCGYARSSRPSA